MAHMKDTIIRVAIDLFFKKGYFATSISEIARGCGIQKASIYYHFPGKEDLLFTIMQTTMTDLMAGLQAGLANPVRIEGKMRAAVRNHIRFHLERQKETFIASSELRGLSAEHFQSVVAQRDAYERIFQNLICVGIAEGIFARNDIKVLSYAILTLCTAGATWYRPDGRLSAEQVTAIYENFVLHGLKLGRSLAARPAELVCEPWPI
jgi:TetR/AcrR family transcriptional regulator, cholesterol catabolism regulator